MKRKMLLIIGLVTFSQSCLAQDLSQNFKHWYLAGINARLNPKVTLKINRLNSYDVEAYRHGFHQTSFGLTKRIDKSWEYGGAYAYSVIHGRSRNIPYHRLSAYLTQRSTFGKLRMKNTAQAEWYLPKLPKFGQRLVLTNKWSYYNKRWPLKTSPYIKNQLYYYNGGEPIIYWLPEEEIEIDGEGEEIDNIEQAPNGWHRYRFSFGVRYKLSKALALSLFYTRQIEFNTGWSPYRALNVYNKSKTRIKRPFNNYSLFGMSLTYTFKTY